MRKILLLGLVVFGSGAAEGISKGEFDCWEAVQRLIDCCPSYGFGLIDCTVERGCDNKKPDIDDSTSQCITALSCREIVRQNLCETPPPKGVCQ